MKILHISLISILLSSSVSAQENNRNTLIDAGQVVVDIINLFKKENEFQEIPNLEQKSDKSCLSGHSESICLNNNSKDLLKVFLIDHPNYSDTTEFYIDERGTECAYALPSGIYTYISILVKDNSIARKGQIRLSACAQNSFAVASK